MRNTYVSGLRAALAIVEKRAEECRAEEVRHREGDRFQWQRFEAECIAGRIRRLIGAERPSHRSHP